MGGGGMLSQVGADLEDLGILGQSIQKISERNESLEFSLALDDSHLDSSYL